MHNWRFELTKKLSRNSLVPLDFFAAKCVGLKILDYDTKKELEVSPEYFGNELDMKGNAILCYENDFDTIKSMVRPRVLL